jgi:nitrate reductase alpha subunit
MNWLQQNADAHWLTEARIKGTRVVVIACEYSATASKGDSTIGTPSNAGPLGLANVILQERLYDLDYVRRWTDLPLLVRMDNLKMLKAQEVFGGEQAELKKSSILAKGAKAPAPGAQKEQIIPEDLRNEWGDFVWWDRTSGKPGAVNRDQVGAHSIVEILYLRGSGGHAG